MGCAASTEQKEARKKDRQINDIIEESREVKKRESKVLLLGAGEAGKTTILKQMRLLHNVVGETNFGDAERKQIKNVIADNIIGNMVCICEAMEQLGIPYGSSQLDEQSKILTDLTNNRGEPLPLAAVSIIKALWSDSGVQACYLRSSEFHLNDSAKYFFDAIDRVSAPNYLPTNDDILQCRIKTTGIQELVFKERDVSLKVIDVGGQRSERRKWVMCFEGVTAFIFLAAISEYDQVLQEDEGRNRVREAIALFESIVNSRWFLTSHVILFLNKLDLFELKYTTKGNISISKDWPDYKGITLEDALAFFKNKFMQVDRRESKMIYCHFTCATDTKSIAVVIKSVKFMVMRNTFAQIGLV